MKRGRTPSLKDRIRTEAQWLAECEKSNKKYANRKEPEVVNWYEDWKAGKSLDDIRTIK